MDYSLLLGVHNKSQAEREQQPGGSPAGGGGGEEKRRAPQRSLYSTVMESIQGGSTCRDTLDHDDTLVTAFTFAAVLRVHPVTQRSSPPPPSSSSLSAGWGGSQPWGGRERTSCSSLASLTSCSPTGQSFREICFPVHLRLSAALPPADGAFRAPPSVRDC